MKIIDKRKNTHFEDHDVVEITYEFGQKEIAMIICIFLNETKKYVLVPLGNDQKGHAFEGYDEKSYDSPDELIKGILNHADFCIDSIKKVSAKLILEDSHSNNILDKPVIDDTSKAKLGDVYKYNDSDPDDADYGMVVREVNGNGYALVDISPNTRGLITTDGENFKGFQDTADDILKALKSYWLRVEKVDFFKGVDE